MSAALIDLVSKGAQDVFITGDPQVSFFHQNYKRHTNFSIKPERLDYVGTFGSGNEVVIPLRTVTPVSLKRTSQPRPNFLFGSVDRK